MGPTPVAFDEGPRLVRFVVAPEFRPDTSIVLAEPIVRKSARSPTPSGLTTSTSTAPQPNRCATLSGPTPADTKPSSLSVVMNAGIVGGRTRASITRSRSSLTRPGERFACRDHLPANHCPVSP